MKAFRHVRGVLNEMNIQRVRALITFIHCQPAPHYTKVVIPISFDLLLFDGEIRWLCWVPDFFVCVCVSVCLCVCVSRWLGRCLQDTEAGSEGVPVARGAGGGREQQQSIPWQHLHRCLCVCLFTSSLAGPKCHNASFDCKVQLINLCLGFVLFACFFIYLKEHSTNLTCVN